MPDSTNKTPVRALPTLPAEQTMSFFVGPGDAVYARCRELKGRQVYPLGHQVVESFLYAHLRETLKALPTKPQLLDLKHQAVAEAYGAGDGADRAFEAVAADGLAFAAFIYAQEQLADGRTTFRLPLKSLQQHLVRVAGRDGVSTAGWKTAPTALNAFSADLVKRAPLLAEVGLFLERVHGNAGSSIVITVAPPSPGPSPDRHAAVTADERSIPEGAEPQARRVWAWHELAPGVGPDCLGEVLNLATEVRRRPSIDPNDEKRSQLFIGSEEETAPVIERALRTILCVGELGPDRTPCGACDQCRCFHLSDTLDRAQANDDHKYLCIDAGAVSADEVHRELSKLSEWKKGRRWGSILLYVRRLERIGKGATAALCEVLRWPAVTCLAGCERVDRLSPELLERFGWSFLDVSQFDTPDAAPLSPPGAVGSGSRAERGGTVVESPDP